MTPEAKIEATRGYGAEVLVEGDIYERSYEHALELAESEGLESIHPFNDEDIIAGQGTIGLELTEHDPGLDTVPVSIVGGGHVSGVATAIEDYDPDIRSSASSRKEHTTPSPRWSVTSLRCVLDLLMHDEIFPDVSYSY